jgi:hypothetical protein
MAEHHIETVIEINASCERVWLLTDFEAMPSCNPFIRSIQGELRLAEAASRFISPVPAGLGCALDRTR